MSTLKEARERLNLALERAFPLSARPIRQMREDIAALLAFCDEAVEGLEPFAAKLADIGEDEDDDDGFAEMSPANRRAPRITVGHFRRARTLIEKART